MSNTAIPEAISEAQQEFDYYLARMLESMADRTEGKPPNEKSQIGDNGDEFADSRNNA
jgi:hypothetical protein